MDHEIIYREKLSSNRTEALFIVLTLIFLGLFTWRVTITGWYALTWTFLIMAAFFPSIASIIKRWSLQFHQKSLASNSAYSPGILTWIISTKSVRMMYPYIASVEQASISPALPEDTVPCSTFSNIPVWWSSLRKNAVR